MIKILITGANGQMGQALRQKLGTEYHVISLNHKDLDICKGDAVAERIIEHKPDLIINTAAFTAVDRAESEKENALAVNYEGPKNLAKISQWINVPLLHLSTDYVFSGTKHRPYIESDPPHSLNFYGETKILGEKAIQDNCERHVILRVSGIFSEFGHNFVKTILRIAQEKKELQVVADQLTCPTDANDIANAISRIIQSLLDKDNSLSGIYHYCGADVISWHAFAEKIINYTRNKIPLAVQKINPVTSAEYVTEAHRPVYSVLACKRIKEDFNIPQPSLDPALSRVLEKLLYEYKKNEL